MLGVSQMTDLETCHGTGLEQSLSMLYTQENNLALFRPTRTEKDMCRRYQVPLEQKLLIDILFFLYIEDNIA